MSEKESFAKPLIVGNLLATILNKTSVIRYDENTIK